MEAALGRNFNVLWTNAETVFFWSICSELKSNGVTTMIFGFQEEWRVKKTENKKFYIFDHFSQFYGTVKSNKSWFAGKNAETFFFYAAFFVQKTNIFEVFHILEARKVIEGSKMYFGTV